jgi:hypothetical protein
MLFSRACKPLFQLYVGTSGPFNFNGLDYLDGNGTPWTSEKIEAHHNGARAMDNKG